ncbi:MAG: VCBS domain-containing protein [Pseudomonadota bacterium]
MTDGLIGRIDISSGTVSVEAEDIISDGFTTEDHSVASGGRTVSLLNTGNSVGTLAYGFEGAAGAYDLAITLHDEFDGESTLSIWVNGQEIKTLTLDADTPAGVVTDGNRVVLTVEGIVLDTGDRVEIRAEQDAAEWGRIDRLDFGFVGTVSPPPPPPVEGAIIEAGETQVERLDLSGGFEIESRPDAREGALVRTLDELGEASGTFSGVAGTYQIDVKYFDESDGLADFAFVVNGSVVETWQGTGGTSALGTPAVNSFTVDLQPGDKVTVRGVKGGEELARIDALMVTLLEATEPDNTAPEVNRPIANQTGAEGIPFAFMVPNNTFTDADGDPLSLTAALASGGALPDWLSFDPATNTFSGLPTDGDDGTIDITVTASDGMDDVSDTFRLSIADMGDIPAALNVGLNEAEDLTLDGYVIENRNSASSSQLIRTFGEGEATGQFSGPSGRYRLELGYQEESDGKSNYAVLINGSEVFAFTAEKGPRALGTDASTAIELDLAMGDIVTIRGTRGQEALARLDTIELTALDTGPVNTPTAAENDAATTDEDTAVIVEVLANDTDADGDSLEIASISNAVNGSASANADGTVTFTPNLDFNGTSSFDYTVSDGRGGTDTASVLVTVNAVADPANISGTLSGIVQEDFVVGATGLLLIDDPDAGEAAFIAQTGTSGTFGTFSLTEAGNWSYSLNNAAANVQALDTGDAEIETFTATSVDGTTALINITVNGADESVIVNNPPNVRDFTTGTIPEDLGQGFGRSFLISLGTDPDGDTLDLLSVGPTSTLGSDVFITASGNVVYEPRASATLNALSEGETVIDSFDFTLTDGRGGEGTGTITLTVVGENDPAVIDGSFSGAVTEDSVLEATGALLIDDPDTGEAAFVAQTSTTGTFGMFSLTEAGNWTYSLNNTAANVQALATGDVETETFTVSSIDGTTADITISVNGADEPINAGEAPVAIDFQIGGEVPVDILVDLFASDIVSELASDADTDLTSQSISFTGARVDGAPVSLAAVGFSYNPGAGDTGGFTLDTGNASAFDALASGQIAEVLVDFVVSDGVSSDSGTIGFTVTGTPGEFDLNLRYLGANVPGEQLRASADVGVEEALADIEFSGPVTLSNIAAAIDITDPIFEFLLSFEGDGLSAAYAYAEARSTATATLDIIQSAFTGDSGSFATAIGNSEASASADNSSFVGADARDGGRSSAAATDNSVASAIAEGAGSQSNATADENSEADAFSDSGSTTLAVAEDGSRSEAFAAFNSTAGALAEEASLAVAEAERDSRAEVDAEEEGAGRAIAEQGSEATVISEDFAIGLAQALVGTTAIVDVGLPTGDPIDVGSFIPGLGATLNPIDITADGTGQLGGGIGLLPDLIGSTGGEGFIAMIGVSAPFPLNITPDGPNTDIQSVTVSGLPVGSVLSAGTDVNGDGTEWSFDQAPPSSLAYTAPVGAPDMFNVTITATTPAGTATLTQLVTLTDDPSQISSTPTVFSNDAFVFDAFTTSEPMQRALEPLQDESGDVPPQPGAMPEFEVDSGLEALWMVDHFTFEGEDAANWVL